MASKADKEQWVTGHNGTTMGELSMTSLVTPVSGMLRLVLTSALHACGLGFAPVALLVDYLVTIGPTILSFTRPELTALSLVAQVCAAGFLFVLLRACAKPRASGLSAGLSAVHSQRIAVQPAAAAASSASASSFASASVSASAKLAALNSGRPLFLAEYRAGLMLSTAVAILAVDFVIFPRRFCKTETFGTGLMDTGVGAFLLSHAVTSAQARSGLAAASASGSAAAGAGQPPAKQRSHLAKIFWSVLPLLVIGSARLFTHKAVDYQEHTSEYGVHWNFFYTLAAVALLSESLGPFIPRGWWAATGVAIIAVYQFALSRLGLTAYILEHPRSNLLHANKEGVCSSIGYFALYLIGVELGRFLLRVEPTLARWWRKLGVLAVLTALVWALTLAADSHLQPVSRRMVNLAYLLWTLAFNLLMMCVYLAYNLLIDDAERHPSYLIAALNANQLPAFLLANVCTGAVNLGMNTLTAPPSVAYLVVSVYMVVVVTVVALLFRSGCTIAGMRHRRSAAAPKDKSS